MITNQAQYDAAMERIQILSGGPEGSPEERELVRLILDVEIWHSKHDL